MSSRLAVFRRHPKRTLTGLVAVLAATAVAVGSGADFSSTSSNATNTFTTGVLHHTNSSSGNVFDSSAAASFTGLKPGFGTTGGNSDTVDLASAANKGTVTITNDGDAGTISLSKVVTAAAGSNSAACGGSCSSLDGALKVLVKKDGSQVYDGLVSGLAASTFDSSAAYAHSDAHTYDVYFYLPQTTGNAYQGGSAQVTLNWASS
jgi:spore coat-associated protein N